MEEPGKVLFDISGLNAYFGALHAVRNVTLGFREREVTAIIGPSGCGKSTLLRCLNRMHQTVPLARVTGRIEFHGQDLYAPEVNPIEVRRHIGMVFQRPTPFPTLSIRDNVSAGLRTVTRGRRPPKAEVERIVEQALRAAALWDEVKDRLDTSALNLSGGQQQRLCIARTLAVKPEVVMYDEPCSSVWIRLPARRGSRRRWRLRAAHTQILVTNNTKQAARVGDRTAFLLMGELVEIDTHRQGIHLPGRAEDRAVRHGEVRLTWTPSPCGPSTSTIAISTRSRMSLSRSCRGGSPRSLVRRGVESRRLLRTFNRMNDLMPASASRWRDLRAAGLHGEDVHTLRRRVGMVFQRPNPFPLTVYDNIAYGPRINGGDTAKLDEIVESRSAGRTVGRGQGPAARTARSACPAASSSGCASPAPSRSSRRSCCMDEPTTALDPCRRPRSRSLLTN